MYEYYLQHGVEEKRVFFRHEVCGVWIYGVLGTVVYIIVVCIIACGCLARSCCGAARLTTYASTSSVREHNMDEERRTKNEEQARVEGVHGVYSRNVLLQAVDGRQYMCIRSSPILAYT